MNKRYLLTVLAIAAAMIFTSACGENDAPREETKQEETASQLEEIGKGAIEAEEETGLVAGCYYDKEAYESEDEIDGGVFYCLILRENGEALFAAQDIMPGKWTAEGELQIDGMDEAMELQMEGDSIRMTDPDVLYEPAPEEIIPEPFKSYMETGDIPTIEDIIAAQNEADDDESWSGAYYDDADNALGITDRGNGTYGVDIEIFRLCYLEAEGTLEQSVLHFTCVDPNGEPMSGEIVKDGGALSIVFTDCNWTYIQSGDRLDNFTK